MHRNEKYGYHEATYSLFNMEFQILHTQVLDPKYYSLHPQFQVPTITTQNQSMVLNITSIRKDNNQLKPRQIAVHSAWMLESDLQYKVLTQRFFTLVDLGRREIPFSLSADKRIEINQYWTKISHSKLFKYRYQEHYLLPELQSLPLQVHLHHQKHEHHHLHL